MLISKVAKKSCTSPLPLPFFHSSVSSNIAQAFISPILKSFLHQEIQVRLTAVQAVELILKQGLIHPVQVSWPVFNVHSVSVL